VIKGLRGKGVYKALDVTYNKECCNTGRSEKINVSKVELL
jgi:hypothetical protein